MFLPPQLPTDFYSAHPVLAHIRRAAHAQLNPPAPDALLGVCLARVSALVPVGVTLPGVGGTVNYLVGIVGPPGSGKSTAHRLARRLIPELGEKTLDSIPIGSGEGMVEAYLRRVTENVDGKNRTEKVQAYLSAFYYVDEAEGFINRTKSETSTTLSTLRTLWSGADAGALNAQTETSRHLPDSRYRFATVIGFQPPYAMRLISEDKAGTPQRFLFVSALDRTMPDVAGSDPGPLNVQVPQPGEVTVDREILRLVSERRRKVQRGEIELDPLDAHRDFLQLRTAYLLAVLCGEDRDGATPRWWNLAGQMLDNSRGIVEALRDDALHTAAEQADARIEDRINARETEAEKVLHRIGANLMRCAIEVGKPTTFAALTKSINSRDRHKVGPDDMVRLGYLRKDPNGYYLPGHP